MSTAVFFRAKVLVGFGQPGDAEGDQAQRKSAKRRSEGKWKVGPAFPRSSHPRSGDFCGVLLGHHGQYIVLFSPFDVDSSLWSQCYSLLPSFGGHQFAVLLLCKARGRMVGSLGTKGGFGARNGCGWGFHFAAPTDPEGCNKSKLWGSDADTFVRWLGLRPRLSGSCIANDFHWWLGAKFASGVSVFASDLNWSWCSDVVTGHVLLGWIFRICPPIGGCWCGGAFCRSTLLNQISGEQSLKIVQNMAKLQRNSQWLAAVSSRCASAI